MLIELQAELDEVIQPLDNHAVEFFFWQRVYIMPEKLVLLVPPISQV